MQTYLFYAEHIPVPDDDLADDTLNTLIYIVDEESWKKHKNLNYNLHKTSDFNELYQILQKLEIYKLRDCVYASGKRKFDVLAELTENGLLQEPEFSDFIDDDREGEINNTETL